MIINSVNRSIEFVLGGAITTNQLPFVCQYCNTTREGLQHDNTALGISNNTTAVTILSAPGAGQKREIKSLSVYNADTASATVTVRLNDNATLRSIVVVTILTGEHLLFTTASGWFVLTTSGFIKSTSTAVNLDDLGDVVITTPATHALLRYNGTNWVNGTVTGASSTTFWRGDSTWATPPGITLGTEQASTSGTSIDFTGIPAGTKKITIMFNGISQSAANANPFLIQLGDSGGVEATGYLGANSQLASAVATTNYTTGFALSNSGASSVHHGSMTLYLEDSTDFTWVAHGEISTSTAALQSVSSGVKPLSAELDRVRVTTLDGAATFDAGVINIQYQS